MKSASSSQKTSANAEANRPPVSPAPPAAPETTHRLRLIGLSDDQPTQIIEKRWHRKRRRRCKADNFQDLVTPIEGANRINSMMGTWETCF